MRCTNCGREIQPGSKFCINCGAPVGQKSVSSGKPGEMPVQQRAVVRQKKKMSPAIIALIIVGIAGVMAAAGFFIGKYALSDDSANETKTSESKGTKAEDKSNKLKDGSNGESNKQEEFRLEGVDHENELDYDSVLNKSDYKKYNDGDFSFYYPAGFFNKVERTGDGNSAEYHFTGTDGMTELIYKKEPETGDPRDTIIGLSQEKNSELADVDFYPYKKGTGYGGDDPELKGKKYQGYYPIDAETSDSIYGIVGGYVDSDHVVNEYNFFVSDGEIVYSMCVRTDGKKGDSDGDNRAGYLVDCLYRGLSVTLSSKGMASTYEEFKRDVQNGER